MFTCFDFFNKIFPLYLEQIFVRNPVFARSLDKMLDIVFVGLNIAGDYILFIDWLRFDLVHKLANPHTVTEEEINLNRALEIEISFKSLEK